MKKTLSKNGSSKRISPNRLISHLTTKIEQHEDGVMEIVREHNAENEQNRYARGYYVGMGKAYRNVLAMISNLFSQNKLPPATAQGGSLGTLPPKDGC